MPPLKSAFNTNIKRLSEIKWSSVSNARFPFTYSRMFRDHVGHVLFEMCRDRVWFFAYAVRIASMILRTARFLCVICAEVCVNATAVIYYSSAWKCVPSLPTLSWGVSTLHVSIWSPAAAGTQHFLIILCLIIVCLIMCLEHPPVIDCVDRLLRAPEPVEHKSATSTLWSTR